MRCLMMLGLIAVTAGCAAGPGPADTPPGEQTSYNDRRTLDQALAGYTPGPAVSCLPMTRTPSSDNFGRTVIYKANRRLLYRNDMGPGCEGLGRGDILIATTPTGRFCRGDIVQTIDQGSRFPTGGCAFGDFIPYRKDR